VRVSSGQPSLSRDAERDLIEIARYLTGKTSLEIPERALTEIMALQIFQRRATRGKSVERFPKVTEQSGKLPRKIGAPHI